MPQNTEHLTEQQPEATASPSLLRRLASMTYELLLLLAILFAATFVFIALFGAATHPPKQYLLQLWLLCISGVYFIWFWTHGGQTLAMKTWKLHLVTQHNEPLNWRIALLRFLFAVPSVGTGIGLAWALIDSNGLILHDRLAKTRLVQKSSI